MCVDFGAIIHTFCAQSVLKAITHNGRQLAFTLMFTACVVYIYTLFAFTFFRKFYVQDEGGARFVGHFIL